MTTKKTNPIHVTKRDDGRFQAKKPGASRASAVTDTQREAISRARTIGRNDGGAELNIHGLNGKIRAKDSVPKANDPRSSKG